MEKWISKKCGDNKNKERGTESEGSRTSVLQIIRILYDFRSPCQSETTEFIIATHSLLDSPVNNCKSILSTLNSIASNLLLCSSQRFKETMFFTHTPLRKHRKSR